MCTVAGPIFGVKAGDVREAIVCDSYMRFESRSDGHGRAVPELMLLCGALNV